MYVCVCVYIYIYIYIYIYNYSEAGNLVLASSIPEYAVEYFK